MSDGAIGAQHDGRRGRRGVDRRIVWIAAVIILLIALWFALDHVLFPTLPTPAGAPSIVK